MTGSDKVLAVYRWRDNADMIANGVHKLGWLRGTDRCLDPTYGQHGGMWTRSVKGKRVVVWQPDDLTAYCYERGGPDFRELPHPDGYFDSVLFDPDYVARGGRATSTTKDKEDRYGQDESPATPELLQARNNEGLTEMHRVTCTGGIVLVKTQDYVSSGLIYPSVFEFMLHAREIGLLYRDRMEFVVVPTRERHKDVQQHARRNHSTLLVFQKVPIRYEEGHEGDPAHRLPLRKMRRPAGRGGIRELV